MRFDPQPAFRQALEYLAATGHRRLGLVNGPETLPYFRNLHSAFRESCARFDLTVDEELFYEADPYGDFALDAVLAGRRLFDRPDRPDAVMVSSGILVKSIVVQALQRGVRIPADASIVAFGTNDWEAYKFGSPPHRRGTQLRRDHRSRSRDALRTDGQRCRAGSASDGSGAFLHPGQHRKPARVTAGTSTSTKGTGNETEKQRCPGGLSVTSVLQIYID